MIHPIVSVIIPVKNDTLRLSKCLKALENQTISSESFEVIVIDNNSDPQVPENITISDKIWIKPLKESKPSGFAARNTGVENASGDIFAFTDSDTIPDRNWLEEGCKCLNENKNAPFIGGKVEITFSGKPEAVECFEYFYGFDQEKYIGKKNFAVTANMFTSREMFFKAGNFNSELKSGGDREWGERASRQGKGLYCAAAVVLHPARKDWSELKIKIERTLDGYFHINSIKNTNTNKLLSEIAGDMFPVKQFFNLFFVKRGPLSWKIKAFWILIKLKNYRSLLKLKYLVFH